MAGIFDRLDSQADDDKDDTTGLSPLDVADLPDDQRQVMLTFFRHGKHSGGVLTLASLQQRHAGIKHLDRILRVLTENNWLIRLGEAPDERYKVNFRRRRAGKSKSEIWSSITDRLAEDGDSESSATNSKPNASLPSLSDW